MSEVSGGAPASGAAPASAQAQTSQTESTQEVQGQEGAQSVEAADIDASDLTQTEKRELKKKLKLKVNGREEEREFDLGDDKFLTEMFQKAFSSDERFQKASKVEKDAKTRMEQIARMIQEDPESILGEFGHNMDELAEKHIQKRIQELEKSPEQREMEKLRNELEKEMKKREKLEQERQNAENSRIQEQFARNLNDEISSGLSTSDIPKSPFVVKRIAEHLIAALDNGKNVEVKDVIPLVQKQIKAEIRQMFEAMPEDVIESVLGETVSNKLRQRRIKKMKEVKNTSQIQPTGQTELAKKTTEEAPASKQTARDFFKNL